MSRVFFIRHAAVRLDPSAPSAEWKLSDAGRAAAAALALDSRFSRVERIAVSSESKALATAAPIAQALALDVHEDDDLREVDRGELPILARAEYVALVGRYLDGEPLEGWEPAEQARARFTAAVARHRAHVSGDLAIVSHGLVISLHLGLSPERWEALTLPDVIEAEE